MVAMPTGHAAMQVPPPQCAAAAGRPRGGALRASATGICRCCCVQVTSALTRTRKEETVVHLKEKLDDSVIVFGLRHKGLNVSHQGGRVGGSCSQRDQRPS